MLTSSFLSKPGKKKKIHAHPDTGTHGDTHASTHASLRPWPPGAHGAFRRATCWASVPCPPETAHPRPWGPVDPSAPTMCRVKTRAPALPVTNELSLGQASMVRIVKWSLSHVRLFATPWTVAYQAPRSMGFSRQEYWSGLPFCGWVERTLSA